MALLAAEAASAADTDQIDELRQQLNRHYDAYVTRFGPINRISWRRTGRVDEISGEDKLARISPPQGGFRIDPHSPAVYALEDFDATTGTARKALIFTTRVVAPRLPRRGADTPADAVAICLDTHGEVRLDEVARLLGRTEDDTRNALDGLVFADPDRPERLIPAPAYLSGDVRTKLAAAEAAADRDMDTADGGRRWDANIAALREVLPPDLTPAEIDARLGASWIDADTVQQFLRELLADQGIAVEHPGGSTWGIRATNPAARHSVLATSTYGTERLSAIDIAHALLEQRQIRIFDELDDGRRIPNLTETVAAQEKAGDITERFSEWIWDDPERAATLSRRYNDMFNNIVLRSYDGAHMQLPGLAVTFTPHEHQLAAVARIVSEPAVLLAHEVGAGKTASMVISAMELRRLGMANKPCVVVPNHMLEQFTREWMQLYPQARVLATSIDDLAKRQAPPPRRPHRHRRLGRRHRVPLRLRTHPPLPRRTEGVPRRTAGRHAPATRGQQARPRADRQTPRRRAGPRRGTDQEAHRLRQGPRHHLRADRHRLPVLRRSPRLQEPGHRLQHPRRRGRRCPTGQRPGHETGLPARPPRRPRRHVRHRHPDREQRHRGVHHAALPAPRPTPRVPDLPTSTPGQPPSAR